MVWWWHSHIRRLVSWIVCDGPDDDATTTTHTTVADKIKSFTAGLADSVLNPALVLLPLPPHEHAHHGDRDDDEGNDGSGDDDVDGRARSR